MHQINSHTFTSAGILSKYPKNASQNVFFSFKCVNDLLLNVVFSISGSVEHVTETMWVFDENSSSMVQKEITYVPGLYKIFDEILVNAADNKQRDPKMDCIKIEISK